MDSLLGKSFYIKTYGCQMNVYDSEKVAAMLQNEGMVQTEEHQTADVIILNTCHIRDRARHKVYTELGFLKKNKEKRLKDGKCCVIAVGGCVAQAEGGEIFKNAPFVDVVFGTQTYHQLPAMLDQAVQYSYKKSWQRNVLTNRKKEQVINIDFTSENKMDYMPMFRSIDGSEFLAIQEGCNKFCTYCVVPYTRGMEVSRPADLVLKEARAMADAGIKSITLLGQNVNAYRGLAPGAAGPGEETWNFSRLLYAVAEIPGVERIFYTSSHPLNVDLDLMKAHAEIPALIPFVHLPIQSGSNDVLRKMNRKHTAEEYIDIIEKFREYTPHIAFASDFIVGFPGETEKNFEETLALVEKVRFAQAFSFKYSRRPGTAAYNMVDQIDEAVKVERLRILQDLLQQHQIHFNKQSIGQVVPVAFQKHGKFQNQVIGKSKYMQSVVVSNINPAEFLHSIRLIKIKGATLSSLEGVVEQSAQLQSA
ncbi:MAG: tRNA (N6-isopentenyl adenosine(37)-C2)-methylthiotransferase MiaB [Holosporales bacterium]|jgi:tRNA-2-methylthio-N6-dimethylallyladenosine synthase|nr:tRNA (N6-isopentenyl adenosine(37)-C2)-methylthiotransferase MiaB [Holosporales bacterium]